MLSIADYIKIFVAVFVILDPLVAVPSFVNLTSNEPRRKRNSIALVTALSVFVILSMSVLVGIAVLRIFGVGIDAFRVGGGILLLLMGISMLQARVHTSKQTPEETLEAEDKETVAVVPLAIPLLAGPGSISTIIVYTGMGDGIVHKIILCGICFIIAVLVWTTLRISNGIGRALGKTGMNIANRLMGLLLTAIGVEFIVDGIKGLFPNIGG